MTFPTGRLAVGGIALLAATVLAACGSASTRSPAASTSIAPAPTSPSAAATHDAADVAFTAGILRLESQARTLGALVAGHATGSQLLRYVAQLRVGASDYQHMSGLMRQWHQPSPSPYQPGTGMGPGMMSGRDWADMQHQYGREFGDHWLDAMMHNRAAELELCRYELRAGTSSQARHMARAMLRERRAEISRLQGWHHAMDHPGDHAGHGGD